MGNDVARHIPESRQFFNMRRIAPIAKPRQISVSATFARILGRRLSVHLINRAAVASAEPPARADATACEHAKRELADAKTSTELDLATRKVELLCNG